MAPQWVNAEKWLNWIQIRFNAVGGVKPVLVSVCTGSTLLIAMEFHAGRFRRLRLRDSFTVHKHGFIFVLEVMKEEMLWPTANF